MIHRRLTGKRPPVCSQQLLPKIKWQAAMTLRYFYPAWLVRYCMIRSMTRGFLEDGYDSTGPGKADALPVRGTPTGHQGRSRGERTPGEPPPRRLKALSDTFHPRSSPGLSLEPRKKSGNILRVRGHDHPIRDIRTEAGCTETVYHRLPAGHPAPSGQRRDQILPEQRPR